MADDVHILIDRETRLQAIDRAIESLGPQATTETVIERAKKFEMFLMGNFSLSTNTVSTHNRCVAHNPVQHRDGKLPWCDECGLDKDFKEPISLFDFRKKSVVAEDKAPTNHYCQHPRCMNTLSHIHGDKCSTSCPVCNGSSEQFAARNAK